MYKTDKEKFQEIKKYCKTVYNDVTGKEADNMGLCFPYGATKLLFGDNNDITETLDNLKVKDFGIDGFFIDTNKKEIIFLQFKAVESFDNNNLKDIDLRDFKHVDHRIEELDKQHNNFRVNEIRRQFLEYKEEGYDVKKYFVVNYILDEKKIEEKHNVISLDICRQELEANYHNFLKLIIELFTVQIECIEYYLLCS
jgi:hypothetical protein